MSFYHVNSLRGVGARSSAVAIAVAMAALAVGCSNPFARSPAPDEGAEGRAGLSGLAVVPLGEPTSEGAPFLSARAARNEWVDAYVRVPAADGRRARLRVVTPTIGGAGSTTDGATTTRPVSGAVEVRVYRVASLPFDTRGVAAVRYGGPGSAEARLPRALIELEAEDGAYALPAGTTLVYVEMRAPLSAEAGEHVGAIEFDGGGREGAERIPVTLAVDDLALSDAPSVSVYGEVAFEDLGRLFPRAFAGLDAKRLSRLDAKQIPAVERLDQIVRLARAHRLDVGFTRLQPVVKRTPREGLTIDWADYDSVVMPWLTGEIDPSREGLTAFPLPVPDLLLAGGVTAEEYLGAAVSHFEQRRVLGRTLLPAELPESALRGELGAKVRRVGAGVSATVAQDEAGVRHAAWASFVAGADAARAGAVSPGVGSATEAGDAARGVWFYPASWFGVDEADGGPGVVPSAGVKWARRAQQDREILELARRRGAGELALSVARLATRDGTSAPRFAGDLLVPTREARVWGEGLAIVRSAAAGRAPGGEAGGEAQKLMEEEALARFTAATSAPAVVPARVVWSVPEVGLVRVSAEVDVPDAGAEPAVVRLPDGWTNAVPVRREGEFGGLTVSAVLDLGGLRYPVTRTADERGRPLPAAGSLGVEAFRGEYRSRRELELSVPAAYVLPAPEAARLELDGRLGEWAEEELVHAGGLVRMLDRASAQGGGTVREGRETRVYARWEGGALHLSVRAAGVGSAGARRVATNFSSEAGGRAVGEELIRLRVGAPGATPLRLLIKPMSLTVESGGTGPGVRYAATVEDGVWRAELTVPAALIGGTLRDGSVVTMNLMRHDPETGTSASWAGPVDVDAQDVSGLLVLVDRVPRRTPGP